MTNPLSLMIGLVFVGVSSFGSISCSADVVAPNSEGVSAGERIFTADYLRQKQEGQAVTEDNHAKANERSRRMEQVIQHVDRIR